MAIYTSSVRCEVVAPVLYMHDHNSYIVWLSSTVWIPNIAFVVTDILLQQEQLHGCAILFKLPPHKIT